MKSTRSRTGTPFRGNSRDTDAFLEDKTARIRRADFIVCRLRIDVRIDVLSSADLYPDVQKAFPRFAPEVIPDLHSSPNLQGGHIERSKLRGGEIPIGDVLLEQEPATVRSIPRASGDDQVLGTIFANRGGYTRRNPGGGRRVPISIDSVQGPGFPDKHDIEGGPMEGPFFLPTFFINGRGPKAYAGENFLPFQEEIGACPLKPKAAALKSTSPGGHPGRFVPCPLSPVRTLLNPESYVHRLPTSSWK